VAALVPDPEQFVDIDLQERDANLSRRMRGKLVAELSELRGLAKRDLESLKSFITRTHESWIPKFREFELIFPRRLVFVGTTNHEQFLEDETGNRRWLPVHVRAFNREAVERDRDQLWAEGAARWRAGGIAWAEAERLAAPVHAEHMVTDSWDYLIEKWLAEREEGAAPFPMAEALRYGARLEPNQMNRAAELRAGRVLSALGWKSKMVRLNGRLTRRWAKM
jgi:predicted P-loop ATPase